MKAEEKGIALALEVVDSLPETFDSDPARLRQIVTNLVGNAIKFTEEGGVTVRVARDGEVLRVAIVDTGIGMDEAQQASIFDAFTQADASITRRFGGTGLGLSISRELARALGGDVSVASAPGRGSTFDVTPAARTRSTRRRWIGPGELLARVERTERPHENGWHFPPARVLVVDDAAENRELLALVLGDLGLRVTLAADGQQALDAVAEARGNPFAAILMDIQMPVMDGYEAVGRLRESGLTTPVVALTANAMKGYEARLLDAGFSHYQTKPIDMERLSGLLASLLGGTRAQPVSRSPEAGVAPALPVSAAVTNGVRDVTKPGDDLSASDDPVATRETGPLVSSLLASNPKFHTIVERFLPRLDEEMTALRTALEAEGMEDVARIAHWLKGSAGNVGFGAFTKPAERLERRARAGDVDGARRELALVEDLVERVHAGWVDDRPAARAA